jgi:uncharacterized protein
MKLLMWLILGVVVYWALRSQLGQIKRKRTDFRQHQAHHTSQATPPSAPAENMVACAYCQIYLPASEALHISEHYFCSQEHAKLHASKSSTE